MKINVKKCTVLNNLIVEQHFCTVKTSTNTKFPIKELL